jgi:hypothetical protein
MRLALFVILASAGPASADKSGIDTTPLEKMPRTLASLERFGCEGDCPAYKVTVYVDGQVVFDPRSGVKQKTMAAGTLSAADLAAITKAFVTAGFASVATRFDCGDDAPVATTFYDDGKSTKTVVHDPICDDHGKDSVKAQAKAMSKLETEIDRITNSVRWVGTQAERDALRKAGKLY